MISKNLLLLIIALTLFVSANLVSQISDITHGVELIPDSDKIKIELDYLVQSMREGDFQRIKSVFYNSGSSSNENVNNDFNINALKFDVKSVTIGKDSATIICNFSDGEKEKETKLTLTRKGEHWKLVNAGDLQNTFVKQMNAAMKNKPVNNIFLQSSQLKPSISSSPYIVNAGQALIPAKHPSMDVHEINASFTTQYLSGKQLFSGNARLDVDGVLPTNLVKDAVAFYLDPGWNRIIFGNNDGAWIKSFGDHVGDGYTFNHPQAMEIDHYDTIYVADSDNGKIVKLFYNRISQTISYVTSINVGGHPVDISIDRRGFNCYPALDRIWIADDYSGRLRQMFRSGIFNKSLVIEYYTVPGSGTFRLRRPTKILASSSNPSSAETFLAFIDADRKAFVTADVSTISGTTVTAYNSTEFSSPTYDLASIGQDLTENFWVADNLRQMLHTFYYDGRYVASYTGSAEFKGPLGVSKRPIGFSVDCSSAWVFQYVFTVDHWGYSSGDGIRAFFPGADVVDVLFSQVGNNAYVTFTPTNYCYLNAYIVRASDNCGTETRVATLESNAITGSYRRTYTVNASTWRTGWYVVKVEVLPYYNSYYGGDAVGWLTRTGSKWWTTGQFSVSISGPSTLNDGETGTWTANVSGGSGNYRYEWDYKEDYGCCWVPQGTSQTQSRTLNTVGFYERCRVYDNCLNLPYVENTKYVSKYTPPSSCPFVFTWDGTQFREDNNILPQSVDNDSVGKNVVDYYRLMKPLAATNGVYKLQIKEDATERSLLDNFKLIAVDHPQPTNIIVSKSGEIIQYITPRGLQNARLNVTDVTAALLTADSITVTTADGDSMLLSFGTLDFKDAGLSSSSEGGVVLESSDRCKGQKCPPDPAIEKMSNSAALFSASAITTPRLRSTLMYIPFRDVISYNPKLRFSRETTIDYVSIGVKIPASFQTTELLLVSAVHSQQGDVKSMLMQTDSMYAVLDPSESIELQFAAPPVPSGKKRTFILVSHGQYFTLESNRDSSFVPEEPTSEVEITEFGISPNYPNPFNPLTKIDFQLPVDGQVKIVVYDIMGREVEKLVDQRLLKGKHTFTWDASGVASGMYFCRYFVTDNVGKVVYNDVKKMLLMR